MLPLYEFIALLAVIILSNIVITSIRHLGDKD